MIAFEKLETVLREIGLTLNNRPLTFTYETGDELLTPSRLIHGCRLNVILINQSEEEHTHFEDGFVCLSKILVDFRNLWNKEHLLQLVEHFKYKNEKGLDTSMDTCNKGNIVFVYEPNKKEQILKQV